MMKIAILLVALVANASAFQMKVPSKVQRAFELSTLKLKATTSHAAQTATAAAVTFHAEAAHAKSVLGVNGALDFGPLAGDQPGGEGTGKALGVNDDSLFFVLFGVVFSVGFAFSQWQDYQDDEDDFFDTYDSRRNEREGSRNRDLQAGGDANRQFGNKPKVFGSR